MKQIRRVRIELFRCENFVALKFVKAAWETPRKKFDSES